ncbi:MAG: ATP-binding protein [Simkania sp.]|nr:ATP-binding protein [Simkania sp.]
MEPYTEMQEISAYLEHVSFQARKEYLAHMIAWVHERIQNMAFQETDRLKIELAMEEALVNIIMHAYPYHSTRAILEIVILLRANQSVEFTILDKGRPFNPLLQAGKLHIHIDLEKREEGGLGILFMRHCMDEVHYQRQHPFNILTLVKKMKPEKAIAD